MVADIMDLLAKAAVAEISKLVEDGTMVLRLEMCRKDGEIQELNRTLKMLEIELRKAQEAASSRATEDAQVQTAFGTQILDAKEDLERCAVFADSKAADSLGGPQHGAEEGSEMRPTVKHEPADELAMQEPTENTATADSCFKLSERDEPIWPLPSCSVLEKSSVEIQRHMQVLSTYAEQFAAHRNAQSSYDSSSHDSKETPGDCVSVPIKVEVDVQPVCMESTTSESVSHEQFRHASHPAVSQNQCLQSASHRAGQPLSPPRAERCVTNTVAPNTTPEDPILSRNNLRAKRLTSQKLFMCSVCNRGFPRLSQLEEHKAMHQQIKPFRCLECGKSFTQKSHLKTHQSVHTGERPFSCKICGKMFSRQDNCLRHERFHSGLKPYSCGQCGKSFTVLGNLKIHQDIHLQGR